MLKESRSKLFRKIELNWMLSLIEGEKNPVTAWKLGRHLHKPFVKRANKFHWFWICFRFFFRQRISINFYGINWLEVTWKVSRDISCWAALRFLGDENWINSRMLYVFTLCLGYGCIGERQTWETIRVAQTRRKVSVFGCEWLITNCKDSIKSWIYLFSVGTCSGV